MANGKEGTRWEGGDGQTQIWRWKDKGIVQEESSCKDWFCFFTELMIDHEESGNRRKFDWGFHKQGGVSEYHFRVTKKELLIYADSQLSRKFEEIKSRWIILF